MNIEYLIFNLIIIYGPLALSFDEKVAFYKKWKYVFAAIGLMMIPFIIWDIVVTGRHWWFNEKYTLNFAFAGLPIGEWLFFITVPYALLFVWEVFAAYFKNREIRFLHPVRSIAHFGMIPGFILFYYGKEYTGLVFIALAVTAFLDRLFKTGVYLQKRTIHLLLLNVALTSFF
ncbi:lycopene cyclase domain-containing protein, partial [candidate division KSB1 bacterium]|nr:lycopene cyclase domain-containing protein [candidate division KSB1 bacterium]